MAGAVVLVAYDNAGVPHRVIVDSNGHLIIQGPVGDGTYATPTHASVNVTVASGLVLAANANRKYVRLVNDSDTVIYIKEGAAAVLNQACRLNANGGSFEMSAQIGNLYLGGIYAIHGGVGNKVLLITEGT